MIQCLFAALSSICNLGYMHHCRCEKSLQGRVSLTDYFLSQTLPEVQSAEGLGGVVRGGGGGGRREGKVTRPGV